MKHSKETQTNELEAARGENKISRKAQRQLRQLLLTAAMGGAMIAAPQVARAVTATGTHNTTQTFTGNNENVAADNTFTVNATVGDAVDINGAGAIVYNGQTDVLQLTTTAITGDGLQIDSTGNQGSTPGSVTVTTAQPISGGKDGILATNAGTGGISITTSGTITGTNNDGIEIHNTNTAATGNVTVISSGNVTGGIDGIVASNAGTGGISITTSGNVTGGATGDGILLNNTNALATGNVTVNTSGTVSGGNDGISVTNAGLGATSVTATDTVTGTSGDGINVLASNSANTNDVTVTAVDVSGGTNGISAENDGTGDTSVTATGTVTGTSTQGIYAYANNANAGDLTVDAVDVTGGTNGIYAQNKGLGTTSVTVTGTASGTSTDGIYAYTNNTNNTNDLTVNAVNASGGDFGIVASNSGSGDTSVTATGTVIGTAHDGIHVLAANNGGAGAGDLTVNAADVNGGVDGIFAENDGTGDTSVTATGTVTGTSTQGIYAYANNANAGDLTVDAVDVTGGTNGIYAQNKGLGTTSVTVTGTASGASTDGIYAYTNNTNNTNDLTVSVVNASGGQFGIVASNSGSGNTSVTATGTVTGTNVDGIYAVANNNGGVGAGKLTVNAVDVIGYSGGIYAENDGIGDTSVTTTGAVNVSHGNGMDVYAYNNSGAGAGSLTVSVNDVSASYDGIHAVNSGTGATSVTTNGEVQGGNAGIVIQTSSTTNPTTLTVNSGSYVHNSSATPANPSDLAIQISGASGGTATISNSGTIQGRVLLGNENDTFTNNASGTWHTSGNSYFGAGNDTFTNDGIFQAYNSTGTATTNVSGIETVNSNPSSSITMQDGYAGDTTTFTNGGTGNFVVNDGSTLLVDTNIATQQSDVLNVDNVQIGTGPTDVGMNVVAGLGQPIIGDGILVVQDTSSDPNAFTMTPFSGGLYSYYLNENPINENYYLQSAVRPEAVATGVLPILGSRTALSTLSNLHDRQRDENTLSNDDESKKGVWGRVFGQSNDFDANDANDFGFNSHAWGVQAGLDLMASGDDQGNRKYAGLYVAYASSSGDARQFDQKVASLDLNATTIGAYYTKYSSNNWYLDAVAQYSSLGGIHAKTAIDDISPSGKSYALSLEAGKQFHPDASIVREVQAQLIDQYTDIDDVTLNDGTHLKLSSLNAVTGRFGLRLYGNPKGGKSFLPWFRANIWHTFSGDSSISSLGSSISTPIGGTSGELELGFSKGNSQSGGWGFYGSAGYLFNISGAEYSGWKGTLGLRKGW